MNLVFAPLPGRYAAVRIDPLGTVERYDYPDIQAAARAIPTRIYLVFLQMNLNLPIPGRPWHAYDIVPIPTALPPPDAKRAATADMCTPIFPNTYHPKGRDPLQTEGAFPYSNCYHWSDDGLRMDVRVRAHPEGFDEDVAVKLTVNSEMKLQQYMAEDFERMQQTREERRSKAQLQGLLVAQPGSGGLEGAPQTVKAESGRTRSPEHRADAEYDDSWSQVHPTGSITTDFDLNSVHDSESVTLGEIIQDVLSAGIFGSFGDDQEVYPLVDLWLDLPATLKQEDIPDYKDLFKERDAVVELIMEGRRRHKEEAARRVREQEDAGMLEPLAEAQTVAQKAYCRHGGMCPGRVLRGVRAGVRNIRAHVSHFFRLPYIPVWP